MVNDKIVIASDKDLKVVMSPIRQKIMKFMRVEGRPVTSKYIADNLNITPSSARHHIKLLEQLGIIETDHCEVINGITAKYLTITDKTVSLGQNINDELSEERDILARNMIYETYNGFLNLIKNNRTLLVDEFNKGNKLADVLSGVVHLTENEANELYDMVNNFINSHSKSTEASHPFEYTLIAYRADLIENQVKE
ncbi:winged helix-turn-helix domain-containing protein [Sedimentibacter sp. B4]|uniref:winged helix-turn-helix domain-containing protein n=1 Tax=Sedimentibacter sp. B4 TaxID=304766 RepID=UPI0002D2EBDE|nr:winged helix-turn-helix domain-containing protein [Sedimentibacter sp. B4]